MRLCRLYDGRGLVSVMVSCKCGKHYSGQRVMRSVTGSRRVAYGKSMIQR